MNLTLKALQEGKKKCGDMKGLESLMTVAERTEIMESIENLSVSFSQCIGIIEKVSEVKDSLEKFGYTDEWYDSVFSVSGLENIVEFDIPKFTTYGTKQEACMEGFMDTIKDWIVKAWNFLKTAIIKIYQFFMRIATDVLGLDTSRKSEVLNWASERINDAHVTARDITTKRIIESYVLANGEYADDILKDSGGFRISEIYDTKILSRYLINVQVVLDAFNDSGLLDTIVKTISESDKNFSNAESVRSLVYTSIKLKLDAVGLKIDDINSNGFKLQFQGTSNHMLYLYGPQTGKRFPTNKDVDISNEADLTNLAKLNRDFGNSVLATRKVFENELVQMRKYESSLDSEVRQIKDGVADTTSDFNDTHARLITMSCLTDAIGYGVKFLVELKKLFDHNYACIMAIVGSIRDASKERQRNKT